jgi:hypothetical protein
MNVLVSHFSVLSQVEISAYGTRYEVMYREPAVLPSSGTKGKLLSLFMWRTQVSISGNTLYANKCSKVV